MHKGKRVRRPIGRVLVEGGFLSAQDLDLALAEHAQTNELLGQVLVRMGFLNPDELKAVLLVQDHLDQPARAIKLAAGVRGRLGSLLAQAGRIAPGHLELALAEQKRTDEKLGEVLVRLGLLTGQHLNNLLDFQKQQSSVQEHSSPLRLGEILVSTGDITRRQLDDALSKQRLSRKKLGEVLVEEGYLELHHITRGLRIQKRLLTATLASVLSFGSVTGCGNAGGQASTVDMAQNPTAASTPIHPASEAAPVELDVAAYTRTYINGTQVIHIPAGTYRVSGTIALPTNSILEGEGDATVLKVGPSFIGSRAVTNADYARGNSNIVIRNFRMEFTATQLDGGEPGILRFRNVEQLEIHDVTMMIDRPVYGIDLSAQVRNALVEGCTITNTNKTAGGGIMIRNGDRLPAPATSDIIVRNNRFESVSDEPVAAFGWEGAVENVRIENNTIRARGASFGITAFGTNNTNQSGRISRVDIRGNDIEGGGVGAIGVMGGAEDVVVVDNHVTGTDADGIFLHSGGDGLPAVNHVTVMQNRIQDTGRHGIFATGTDVKVDQNDITNCAGIGVWAAAGVEVIGNRVTDAHPGILVDGPKDASIRDNILINAGEIVYLY